MKEPNTFVKYTRSEIDTLPDETDWERVDALTDEDIDAAAASDPDAPPTDASFWKDATVVMPVEKPRKITFDSNVWERVINREEPHFVEINNKIREGKIQAYICEIALNLEAIKKKERAELFENYEPRITVEDLPPENGTFRMQVGVGPNTEEHPGFDPKLWDKLLKARDLGFKVLRMTDNPGTVRTEEIPDDMYERHDDTEEFLRYADLLANCSDFITGLGCGQAAYNQFAEQFNLSGSGGPSIPSEQRKKFSDAIAERVDGYSLSAHYAAGNDFFCTDDKAGNSGTGSIFHVENRTQLENEFGIKIISSCEAAQLE